MRLLVLRFSAMGDVALLTPVLHSLIRRHAELGITLVTRKAYEPFFYNIPGVEVIGVNTDTDYRGLRGLYRLYRELRALGPYTAGVDVHGSLRSRVIKFLFRLSGLKFSNIVKGRREKRAQTRRKNKILHPLPHTAERYMAAFSRVGADAPFSPGPWINPDTRSRALAYRYLSARGLAKKTNFWIGIAPFAGHRQKMWPLEYMHELLEMIRREMDATLFLFGGGEKEIALLEELKTKNPNAHVLAGSLSLEGELAFIPRLDVMLAMDSLNMHLAALLGTPVLSIWGPTHPYSGFGPYGQEEESVIQIPGAELPCRPCSIFGKKPCYRGDLACMNRITPRLVFERLSARLYRADQSDNQPQTD